MRGENSKGHITVAADKGNNLIDQSSFTTDLVLMACLVKQATRDQAATSLHLSTKNI